MSESESGAGAQWLDDPPDSWDDAPEAPPAPQSGPDVMASEAGGLLLHERGTQTRFLFTPDPTDARQ